MKVIYSIGSKFGGHGIGGVALHAVQGIYRERALKKVLASYQGKILNPKFEAPNKHQILNSKTRIPKRYVKTMGLVGRGLRRLAYWDQTGWGYVVHDNIFDRWAASQLEPCDIFHGWNHHCLFSLRRAKELGAVTVVERASSHILTQNELLQEEYKRWGVSEKPIRPWVIKKCLAEFEEADYITVPSQFAYDSMVQRGVAEKKLLLIPFGVTLEEFGSYNKESIFVALFVGEVGLRKGIPYLLQAWSELNLKDAELWLVGAVAADIKKVVEKYRDCEDIKFLGFRRDVPELMAKADIFVFPSIEEGSALVTYETMAAGLPVITTPNAGSLVRDSLDGYLIPIRDPDALAERIEFFYKYPEQAKVMGESGRERVSAFTWERYGEELVKAYIKMLKST